MLNLLEWKLLTKLVGAFFRPRCRSCTA